MKHILRWLFTKLFRVELKGWQHYPHEADRLIIAANHVSRLDEALLWALLPDERVIIVRPYGALYWWTRPLLALIPHLVVDVTHSHYLRDIRNCLDEGKRPVGFPEGRMSVTGALMKVHEAAAVVAEKADALILPVHISGPQYSVFGLLGGHYRWRLLPRIRLTMLAPRRLAPDPADHGHNRRRQVSRQLDDLMRELAYAGFPSDRPLLRALLEAKSYHGSGRVILEDVQRGPLNYRQLLIKSFVLSDLLTRDSGDQRYVGILLPTTTAFVITLFALHMRGRVPVVLNYTLGAQRLVDACKDLGLKTVYTSRAFVKAAKLQEAIKELETEHRIVYLEALQPQLRLSDKLRGLGRGLAPARAYGRLAAGTVGTDPAVVLFTSGSEGKPKGVVLSHRNLLANCAQVEAVLDPRPSDVLLNALPLFHSFGLTAGTLVGLMSGFKVFLYPSPLHYRVIPQLAYEQCATLLLGTNTFLKAYGRTADTYDFFSLRLAIGGAEAIQEETQRLWMEKFGVRVLEGYGVTEASPLIAVNSPRHFRPGTVGRLVPGIEYYLKPVEGLSGGGRLCVRGGNIMAGYWQPDKPGELLAPGTERGEGWYDTGDIVAVDADGFVAILGRAKRFAKIAGEMVSLLDVERVAERIWPEHQHAATHLPDPARGERIILLSTNPVASPKDLAQAVKELALSNLLIPSSVVSVNELPLLGSGKLDYVGVRKMAEERFSS